MKPRRWAWVLAAGQVLLLGGQAPVGRGSMTIDVAASGPRIPSSLYGIFFEEINHAGEGGLYGELIQNRGFEDANVPPACSLVNHRLVPPRTPSFWTGRPNDWTMPWSVATEWPGWSLEATGGGAASLALVDSAPLSEATPHSLQATITSAPESGRVAVVNDGFWGVPVKEGDDYRLSFYARAETDFTGPIVASIETASGKVLASTTFTGMPGLGWKRYTATLRAMGTAPQARFALRFGSIGRVCLDFVSLFPVKTFKNRPNGMRPDLAEMIADLKPAFIRWPGGCFVEGLTIESRPQWKRTLGRLEDRPGTYSPWGYWSSDGFGYHEFLQFAEDVGADALYVVNAGVSCAFRSGTFLPDEALPGLIQDTLDAIEYAIGPVDSTWGGLRAKQGHPRPFPLKYIEVGNEDQGPRYGQRFAKFYQAIKARYPQMKVALSSWIAGIDHPAIAAAGAVDIVDEHAYKPLNWSVENFDSFRTYPREAWDLYIGEFATNSGVGRGNLLAALGDAAYMMSVEKNSDLVKMASYAPLLENVNRRDWDVNMIHFDSSRVFARATYYVNKLIAENRPDVNLQTAVTYQPSSPRPIAGRIGVGTWNTSAEFKDIRVETGGTVVYQSEFSAEARGWTPDRTRGGTWTVEDGAYHQQDPAVAWSYFGEASWTNLTVSLRARKLAGAEGFLVALGTADNRRVQWNVGGWGNTQHAIQAADAIVGQPVRGRIEAGRWYDVRVEVRDRTLRCYLDGQLVSDLTLPRIDTLLAIAGKDARTGDVIIKAVNTSPEAARIALHVGGARLAPTGRLTVLTSSLPTDENSFDTPTKIAPLTTSLSGVAQDFVHIFPPYSLSVLRLPVAK